jgi:hypothetical protein
MKSNGMDLVLAIAIAVMLVTGLVYTQMVIAEMLPQWIEAWYGGGEPVLRAVRF